MGEGKGRGCFHLEWSTPVSAMADVAGGRAGRLGDTMTIFRTLFILQAPCKPNQSLLALIVLVL